MAPLHTRFCFHHFFSGGKIEAVYNYVQMTDLGGKSQWFWLEARMQSEALESYLTGDYHRDKKEVDEIETLLEDVSETIAQDFNNITAWPYQVEKSKEAGRQKDEEGISQSTTGMILLATLC